MYTDKPTNNINNKNNINNINNINNKSMILGLYSYILSNNGAKQLITKAIPIDIQVDSFISMYNDINKDFKRYLSKDQLFKAGVSIGNTHNKCDRCNFYQKNIINYIEQK